MTLAEGTMHAVLDSPDGLPSRTRLAPSPTGALHLGNASSFVVCWALARKLGWEVVLRIEDLDGPRIKHGSADAAQQTLRWLGVDWVGDPLVQSRDLSPYIDAMRVLAAGRLIYPCTLSRKEIAEAASAPHGPGHEAHCPASVRPASMPTRFDDPDVNWRFATPQWTVEFRDRVLGPQRVRPAESVGDFVVWTKQGLPSYQLACAVDDSRQGIGHIVRGSDLVDSTGRQFLLRRSLGVVPEPEHWHLPLILGPDGRRLAKRHGDTRLSTYREAGVPPERIIGLLGRYHGVRISASGLLNADEFVSQLDPTGLSPDPIVFTQEDHEWLLDGTG